MDGLVIEPGKDRVSMAQLTIYKDNFIDSTVVSNRFIDEYMKDANDAQLKVYLYLLRMMNANQATSVSDIADKFNHTEKDVIRALKYWEKQKLLKLEFDGGKNLCGIHLCALPSPSREDMPVCTGGIITGAVSDTGHNRTGTASAADSTAVKTIPMPSAVAMPPQSPSPLSSPEPAAMDNITPFAKPVYSPDQLRAFKSREDTSQLLFVAESYIGKPLTPAEMKSILFFTDILHFSVDLIDYLIQYCVDRGKKDFKYIEKVAINWAEEGISTPRQAQKFSTRYDKSVYAIMNELGKSSSPTGKELEYINRWTREYGFTTDIIFEACERTVLATDKHRFEYAEGILSSWKRENVHSKADINRIDDLYQQKKKTAKPASTNKFNQFAQNSYDFDALEKELLSN